VEFAIAELKKRTVIAQMYILDQSYLRAEKNIDLNPYRLEYFRSVWEAGSVFDPGLFERWHAERPPVDKMDLYFTSEADRDAFRAVISQRGLEIAGSIGLGIEVSSKLANKASGLKALCEILGIAMEDTIAVGDSDNDRVILRAAGFSVAMGNANDTIKAIANAITDDNDHHGAAKALEKYLLAEVNP
jgi:hydroxymethylpyrimidine pyrophosphatase-like HAD family hydrolase